jgi:hypothetical protein
MKRLTSALKGLEAALLDRTTRPGLLVRQLAGREQPDDAKLAELLLREREGTTMMDGSIGESLMDTAWAAWEMMDVGADIVSAQLTRLVGWVVGALEGTVATGAAVPLSLPNGAVLASFEDAMFAARCLGLRTVMRARADGRPMIAHQVAELAASDASPSLTLAVCAMGAMALAPPPHHSQVDAWVTRMGEAQGTDGTWTGADLFHALDGLIITGTRAARELIVRASPALLRLPLPEGDFLDASDEERALIAYRALRIAAEG